MTTALYFHPDGYPMGGPTLMGRNAAGNSFLRGWLAHSEQHDAVALVEQAEYAEAFRRLCTQHAPARPTRVLGPAQLADGGVTHVYYPGPNIHELAWQRQFLGRAKFSLTGITHTTASSGAMDSITDLLTAPLAPWDALICTSAAVVQTVRTVLEAQAEYLRWRFGATRFVPPQLPLIPLGINVADFAFSAAQRAAARERLGVAPGTLVVLFTGRLSFHAKAHPLAMYQALARAQAATGARLQLVECGWHANEYLANAFAEAARAACPDVPVTVLDGRRAEDRSTAWASADLFCSLSDNIQETYGLTPLEAMAAGLPVVVSDWDGYRETVRDEIDGFRVPTLMPPAPLGGDLARRHALGVDSYDLYCGHSSQLVAVDVAATAAAFEKLIRAPELRARMGEAGRARAQEFDWSVIVRRYEDLWRTLDEARRAHKDETAPPAPWPARMDPFAAFAGYPTHTLAPTARLRLAREDAAEALARWRALAMVKFSALAAPSVEECDAILARLARGPATAAQLVAEFAPERRPLVFRGLVWLVKLGVVELDSAA
ncbi:MAG: glycosyltransferase family 4 protein [Betaproteobacteria bacterium]